MRPQLVLVVALLGCSARTLPPRGEALIIVDTDVPLGFVDRLRVDVFEDGHWLEARDIARRDIADWPASFSVYTDDTTLTHRALIRIRAYPDGKVRDYFGERFVSRASGAPNESAIPAPPADGAPTLVRDGQNVTPPSEPHPFLAIDRLIRVDLVPGTRGSVRVVLRGACLGTMADLRGVQTCIDHEAMLAPVSVEMLASDMSIPKSMDKTFGAVPDPPVIAPRPGEIYVPGGAFIFGNDTILSDPLHRGVPERFAIVQPFYMDKLEVSVGRWREALGGGFTSPDATPVAGAPQYSLDWCTNVDTSTSEWCSWQVAPGGRENFALTCVSRDAARAFCKAQGGDLPTEAQWEWAAQAVDRSVKSTYPWGDDAPTCTALGKTAIDRAIWGRGITCSTTANLLLTRGKCLIPPANVTCSCNVPSGTIVPSKGPQRGDLANRPGGDVTSRGIVNLGGGVSELVRDGFHSLESRCWAAASMVDPFCDDSAAPPSVRGGNWMTSDAIAADIDPLRAGLRNAFDPKSIVYTGPTVGFRCVRPAR